MDYRTAEMIAEDEAYEAKLELGRAIARDNAEAAIDQQSEYESLQAAFESYYQNAMDTVHDEHGNDLTVFQAMADTFAAIEKA